MGYKKLSIIIFFAIIVIMPMVTFLSPKKSFSQMENRSLQKPPKITLQNLADRTYMKDAEAFLSDHMVFRTEFASAKTIFELAQGRRETNGVYIDPEMLLEKVNAPTDELTKGNLEAINQFAAKYKDTIETSVMLIPTASEIYPERLPQFAPAFDQSEYIESFYRKLSNAATIDAYGTLLEAASSNDIFYKTDHHWTSHGAYLGYTAMGEALGFEPFSEDSFDIEAAADDFLGTLYSKVLYRDDLTDTLKLYHYKDGENGKSVVKSFVKHTSKNKQTYQSIFFRDNLKTKDKYTVFLDKNEAVVKINTNVKNGKKIILFKDSFSHAMMQFLPLHYEEIALVDLRYLNKPITEYLNLSDYNQAVFMYNMAGFVTDSSVKKASAL